MNLSEVLKDRTMQGMNIVHRSIAKLSKGRLGGTLGAMPVFEVTTTGRSSGRARTVMLTAPVRRDDMFVFVASKGGDDRHPDWYRNLVAHPEFSVRPAGGGDPIALVARTATTEEKAALWPEIVDAYRGYAGYQKKTDRDIPVVIAQPASA
ncbi:MAG: nitroreductase/quinone reductase family protein [Ilumatobacteraceae bacterium]